MKKYIFLLFFASITLGSSAQIVESAAIDSVFSEWDNNESPGCALGIFKDGELIYSRGYGLANMEYHIPNSDSSVFRIGSTSKQFTAACIILLAEKGDLSLDTSLKSFFPDFPEYANRITVKHLLNHTSGIRDYLQLAYLKGLGNDDYYTDENIMDWLINQSENNFEPGEEFLYSNSGYWLLGQIVREVSGLDMAEFAQKELFAPLGMTQTHFHNNHNRIVEYRASGYVPDGERGYRISMTSLDMIGDGGIFTTIKDAKKWDDAYYSSDVLSKTFWEMMTERGVLNNGEEIDYASGLFIDKYKGLNTIDHGGAFVGFRAELVRFPDQHLSIAIFANRGDANPSRKAYEVADILLRDEFIEEAVEISEESEDMATEEEEPEVEFSFDQIAGDYEIQPGVVVRISVEGDSLNLLQTWNESTYNIFKIKGNSFGIPGVNGERFVFTDLEEGMTQTLTYYRAGGSTAATRKKKIDTSAINLKDFEGTYYSTELDVSYIFEVEDDILKGKIQGRDFMECAIADIDQFTFRPGLIVFARTDGRVTSFLLDSGRVKNVKFVKK